MKYESDCKDRKIQFHSIRYRREKGVDDNLIDIMKELGVDIDIVMIVSRLWKKYQKAM